MKIKNMVALAAALVCMMGLGDAWHRQAPFSQLVLEGLSFLKSQDVHLYVVIPTYNNEEWCIRNIESLKEQTYPYWTAIILNDCSTDRTSEILHAYLREQGLTERVRIIDNKKRCGACRNIYDAIQGSDDRGVHEIAACPDAYVVVLCDGDDWFATPHALARVALEYRNPQVWLTYGQYRVYPNNWKGHCAPYPVEVVRRRAFREFRPGAWNASHLRTFRAGLFKQIHKEDLMLGGEFLPVTWDVAMFAPMLELCCPEGSDLTTVHFRYIDDILYVYNTATPLNDYKQHFELQQRLDRFIRSKPKYPALAGAPW